MDNYKEDTIKLNEFKTDKIIAYKVSYVIFYFDLKEGKKDFSVYWERYKEAIRQIIKDRSKGKYDNSEYTRRAIVNIV